MRIGVGKPSRQAHLIHQFIDSFPHRLLITAGADDFTFSDDAVEVVTDPSTFSEVRDALEGMGYAFASAQVEQVPSTYTAIDDPEVRTKMNRLLEALEDNDDVQEVWHNWENPDEDE